MKRIQVRIVGEKCFCVREFEVENSIELWCQLEKVGIRVDNYVAILRNGKEADKSLKLGDGDFIALVPKITRRKEGFWPFMANPEAHGHKPIAEIKLGG